MLLIFALACGAATFCVLLPLLAFVTAWLADLTGLFAVLFIKAPTRQMFRALRWLVAIIAAVTVVMLID